MIEYKELSSLPYEAEIKAPKSLVNQNPRRSNCCYAYSAKLHTTKRGVETLIVAMYAPERNKPLKHWPLAEIHFLNSSGDFASAGYVKETKELHRGDFRVGNRDYAPDGWYCSNSHALIHEYQSNRVTSISDADSVIFDFAKRHNLLKRYSLRREHSIGISWLADYQLRQQENKALEAAKRREMRTAELMKDFKAPPKEFEEWTFSEVLNTSAWFYAYNRRSKLQSGKCAACKKVSQLPRIKDRKKIECPRCHRKLTCVNTASQKYDRRAIIGLSTTATVKYIEHIDGNRYVSRTFDAESNYEWNQGKSTCTRRTFLKEIKRDFWCIENFRAVCKEHYNSYYYSNNWEKVKSRWSRTENYATQIFPGNIIEITQSLGIRWICNADLRPLCRLDIPFTIIVNAVSVAPAIENLGKMGLYQLARHYIADPRSGNNDSTSPSKYLGESRTVLEGFAGFNASYEHLKLWQTWKLTAKDMDNFKRVIRFCTGNFHRMTSIIKRTGVSVEKAANYLEKQHSICKKDMLMYWDDYLTAAIELGYDIQSDRELICPPDIKKEHDRCSDLVEIEQNTENEHKYAERRKLLDRLSYSDEDFTIAPLADLKAFLNESRELDHCVKTYYKKCCEGTTNIFGLRKISAPDVPYFTVEISNTGVKRQNRGLRNCNPPKAVTEFTTKWLKQVDKRLREFSLEPATEKTQIKTRIGA